MALANWILLSFALLESCNVIVIYFVPDSKKANGMGVFVPWFSRANATEHLELIHYLVNWVAGVKLALVSLVALIALKGDAELVRLSCGVLLLTTLSFYWRLFPCILQMDKQQAIEPKGYAWFLAIMIALFCAAFAAGFLLA